MDSGTSDVILLGEDERGSFVCARGSIRAALCYPLRERLLARLEDGAQPGVRAVFVDLSRCTYMDSTFIGLLVALDRRLRKASGGRLHILEASPQCRELLGRLGLARLLPVEADGAAALPAMHELEKPAGPPAAEFVLRAHEELMETSEEARARFALLREQLERKVRSEKPPEGSP